MKLFKADTLDEARNKLLEACRGRQPDRELVSLDRSRGRILAEDVVSEENVPGFRKSTVDGYAVKSKDTNGVTESIPVFLDVIDEINMGEEAEKPIGQGQAAYVPTGGMVPDGADAVVMIEYCESFGEGSIAVYDSAAPGRNVMEEGEDVSSGSVILKRGSCIGPQETGALAAVGLNEVPVYVPWKVFVISTGDELVDFAVRPHRGQTRDINSFSISALCRQAGLEVTGYRVQNDDEAALESCIRDAMNGNDIVIVSGGTSQGEKDFTAGIMDRLSTGGIFTHGISVKPGKPTILGYDEDSGTVLAGLPGHPAAAMMICELCILWLFRKITGQRDPKTATARMSENVPAAGGKTTCLLVELNAGDDGLYQAVPVLGKSGLITTLVRADGYVMIDMNEEGLKKDDLVRVALFRLL